MKWRNLMDLKQVKLLGFPILLTFALTGCVSMPDYINAPSANTTNISEESTVLQKNNVNMTRLDSKSINGMWKISINGAICQLSTTHTKQGKYYLASARSCPVPLHDVAAWQVSNEKLVLYDNQNNVIVSLSKPLLEEDNIDDMVLNGTLDDSTLVTMSR